MFWGRVVGNGPCMGNGTHRLILTAGRGDGEALLACWVVGGDVDEPG